MNAPTEEDFRRDAEKDMARAAECNDEAFWSWGETEDREWMRFAAEALPAYIRLTAHYRKECERLRLESGMLKVRMSRLLAEGES